MYLDYVKLIIPFSPEFKLTTASQFRNVYVVYVARTKLCPYNFQSARQFAPTLSGRHAGVSPLSRIELQRLKIMGAKYTEGNGTKWNTKKKKKSNDISINGNLYQIIKRAEKIYIRDFAGSSPQL